MTTDADGAYSFGPVNSAGSAPADLSTAFDVAAVKAGYVFRREAKSDAEPGSLFAYCFTLPYLTLPTTETNLTN